MFGRSKPEETTTLKDVPADKFIAAYAAHLKKTQKIRPLTGHEYLKTGSMKHMQPECPDWYYTRAAALARKIYLRPRIGVGRLKHIFGGVKRNGHCKNKHGRASGKIIRHALIELERAGILTRYKGDIEEYENRRMITREGQKELNEVARNVFKASLRGDEEEEED